MNDHKKNIALFDEFVDNNKSQGEFTHMSVQGGKYNFIGSNYDMFINRYAIALDSIKKLSHIDEYKNKFYSFVQKNPDIKPVIIDIDVKRPHKSSLDRIMTPDVLAEICKTYCFILNNLYSFKKHPTIYVFNRKTYSILDTDKGKFYKDGVHIIIPEITVNNTTMKYICDEADNILCKHPNGVLFNYPDAIDRCVISGPWLMYGSSKDGSHTYDITHYYSDNQLITLNGPPEWETLQLIKTFSIQGRKDVSIIQNNNLIVHTIPISKNITDKQSNKNITPDDIDRIDKILDNYNSDRYDSFQKWKCVVLCIASASDKDYRLFKSVKKFSKKSKKYDRNKLVELWEIALTSKTASPTDKYYKSFNQLNTWLYDDLVLSQTNELSKKIGQTIYYEIINASLMKKISNHLNKWTDSDFGDLLKITIGDVYKSVIVDTKSHLFVFENHIWKPMKNDGRIRDYIEIDLVNIFGQCMLNITKQKFDCIANSIETVVDVKPYESKLNKITNAMHRLKTVKDQNTYIKSFTNKIRDDEFHSKINLNMNLFAFKNGIFDLDKLEFRNGKQNDYITVQTAVNYIGYKLEELNNTQLKIYDEIDVYFDNLFSDKTIKKYMVDLLSRCLMGNKTDQVLILCIGGGRNGKSKLFELISKNFDISAYYSALDITALTGSRPEVGKPKPYFNAFKSSRIVVTSEPSNGVTFNMGIVKELTGGDPIKFRGLYENEEVTVTPQSHLFVLANNPPKLNDITYAVKARLRYVPFTTLFIEPGEKMEKYENRYAHIIYMDKHIDKKISNWTTSGVFMFYLLKNYADSIHNNDIVYYPDSIKDETEQYVNRYDTIKDFIDQELVVKIGNELLIQTLYSRYISFIKERGVYKTGIDIKALIDYLTIELGSRSIKNNSVLIGYELSYGNKIEIKV